MLLFIGIVGPALLIPMYVQTGLGLSAVLSGLVILPGAVFNAFISVYTGKVFDRFGLRVLVIPGFTLLIIMTILHTFYQQIRHFGMSSLFMRFVCSQSVY